ncbi:hypothetical protein B0I35DRAFT_358846 [Stachybotrys elegans]|uniref:AAA+ ATPase domain-containing protein n=1 Tax=Stachybotrys elegans TaxID=80388 RepID=A0A8K0SNV7_9HYPO|nr:hypothetical protein B0I35DRAFT_358846 [Stachybotrys elegans]
METPITAPDVLVLDDDDKNDTANVSSGEREEEEEEPWEVQRRKIPLKAKVEFLDFEHFKNRYFEEDGLAIIEVLCGHHQTPQDIIRESWQRTRRKDSRIPKPAPKQTIDGEMRWVQRVRIQSPQLLLLLSRLTGELNRWETDKPRTFFAPFQPELSIPPDGQERNHGVQSPDLESSNYDAADEDDIDGSDKDSDVEDAAEGGESKAMSPETAIRGHVLTSPITLSHLKTLIAFIEGYIEPAWARAGSTSQHKFRFLDLWMAFKPGELIYAPLASDSSQNINFAQQQSTPQMYQTAWRLYSLVLDPVRDGKPELDSRDLDIHAYYVDYDGTSFVPVRRQFVINSYEGEKDITSFQVYPMRFAKDSDKLREKLHKQGSWFREVTKKRHLSYEGWTLVEEPSAESSESSEKLNSEHISGDVVIDFVEGYKSESKLGGGPSSWKKGLTTFDDSDWPMGTDKLDISHWKPIKNSHRLESFAQISENTQRGEWYGDRFIQEQLKERPCLKSHEDGDPIKDIQDDELLLLPRRVVGYSLRERRFFLLDIQCLSEVPKLNNVFQSLRINPDHKRMVRSLVKTHLENQAAQRLQPNLSLNQDLIRGKGSGLVILLHGVPGVGKTATAEAVAQAYNKPLFVITCGDLGFKPEKVESSLKNIFRLAHLWDCILLLDEADIFLSRRELGDLERNALVSVFLRVLEYYGGILFLTTNRVGTLDEAFKSRIHVSLYYPPLDRKQTYQIFEVNIGKLEAILENKAEHQSKMEPGTPKPPMLEIDRGDILGFALDDFDGNEKTPERRWNGRQIRNAFQIALSLAEFDMRSDLAEDDEAEDEDRHGHYSQSRGRQARDLGYYSQSTGYQTRAKKGVLNSHQFHLVATAISRFEEYLQAATGAVDADRAKREFIRADDFKSQREPEEPLYGGTLQRSGYPRSNQGMAYGSPGERRDHRRGSIDNRPFPGSQGEPTPARSSYGSKPPGQRPSNVPGNGNMKPPRKTPGPAKDGRDIPDPRYTSPR